MGNIFPWKVAVMLESYGISSYVSLSLFLFPLLVSEGDNNTFTWKRLSQVLRTQALFSRCYLLQVYPHTVSVIRFLSLWGFL